MKKWLKKANVLECLRSNRRKKDKEGVLKAYVIDQSRNHQSIKRVKMKKRLQA